MDKSESYHETFTSPISIAKGIVFVKSHWLRPDIN